MDVNGRNKEILALAVLSKIIVVSSKLKTFVQDLKHVNGILAVFV